MKKILQITTTLLLGCVLTNCVDDSIDLDKLNKDIVFSQDNGISIQIGSLAPVYFEKDADFPRDTIFTLPAETNGLFTPELYDYFVIDGKPLGDIFLEVEFYSGIKDALSKVNPDEIKLVAEIINKDGKSVGIEIFEHPFYASEFETAQPFTITIKENEVTLLEKADGLKFQFTLRGHKVEKTDYIQMKNVVITLAGGVKISLD
jgi:hypothetical protein